MKKTTRKDISHTPQKKTMYVRRQVGCNLRSYKNSALISHTYNVYMDGILYVGYKHTVCEWEKYKF